MNIYSWLEQNAREYPKKVCIRYKEENITFFDLHKWASTFAHSLRSAGINRGDRIVLMLPNSPEFVISCMAILSIGAVIVPVNPSFTARELEHIITDSGSSAIILENRRMTVYNKMKDRTTLPLVITTGKDGNFNSYISGSQQNTPEDMQPNDMALMVYSAGLTGYPMGAILTYQNMYHNSDLLHLCFEADDSDTTLTLIPCFHTFSLSTNMLPMIRYGGTIYLMNKLDFKKLHYALTEGGVTCISGVPTLYYALTHHPDLQDIDYTKIRAIVSGGSALSIDIYNEFKKRFDADIHKG